MFKMNILSFAGVKSNVHKVSNKKLEKIINSNKLSNIGDQVYSTEAKRDGKIGDIFLKQGDELVAKCCDGSIDKLIRTAVTDSGKKAVIEYDCLKKIQSASLYDKTGGIIAEKKYQYFPDYVQIDSMQNDEVSRTFISKSDVCVYKAVPNYSYSSFPSYKKVIESYQDDDGIWHVDTTTPKQPADVFYPTQARNPELVNIVKKQYELKK